MDSKHRFPEVAVSAPSTTHTAQTILLLLLFTPFQVLAINRMLNTALQARKFHQIESAQKQLIRTRRIRLFSDFSYLCQAANGKVPGSKLRALYLGFVPYSLLYLAAAALQPRLLENGSTKDSIFHPAVNQRRTWTTSRPASEGSTKEDDLTQWAWTSQGIGGALALNYIAVLALRMSSMENPHKGRLLMSVKSLLTTSPFRAAFCGLLPLIIASQIQLQGFKAAQVLSQSRFEFGLWMKGADQHLTLIARQRENPERFVHCTLKKLTPEEFMKSLQTQLFAKRFDVSDYVGGKALAVVLPVVLAYALSHPFIVVANRVMNCQATSMIPGLRKINQSNSLKAALRVAVENSKLKKPRPFQRSPVRLRTGLRGFAMGLVPGTVFYLGMKSPWILDLVN